MRHRARSDPNHRELVEAFKRFGFAVRTVKWPADAVVCKYGRMAFVEFKRDAKAKLTKDQSALGRDGFPIFVVYESKHIEMMAQEWARLDT